MFYYNISTIKDFEPFLSTEYNEYGELKTTCKTLNSEGFGGVNSKYHEGGFLGDYGYGCDDVSLLSEQEQYIHNYSEEAKLEKVNTDLENEWLRREAKLNHSIFMGGGRRLHNLLKIDERKAFSKWFNGAKSKAIKIGEIFTYYDVNTDEHPHNQMQFKCEGIQMEGDIRQIIFNDGEQLWAAYPEFCTKAGRVN